MDRYPRDMIGYGAEVPDAAWPGGARIAVQIVLNYEEGGENNLLHGDLASEAFLSEIVGAQPWPSQRHWNMESIYEYGARSGFWRLHRMLRDLPVTVFGVATALARSPDQVRAMQEAGWEIASHGWKWIEYKDLDEGTERTHIDRAIRLHTEVTGAPPRGFYQGRASMNTVRLAAETGIFDYIADSYADELPYWMKINEDDQLIVPYTLDCNDMRFATPQGFNSGQQFEAYVADTFDVLYAEGGRILNLGLHCRLIGRPGRAAALQRVINYMASHEGVWFATRAQIAEHWAKTHPPATRVAPSKLPLQDFVAAYGGIFEHSAWIAERAWMMELGPAHDTVTGLHNALCRVFRTASEEERIGVLMAHPDLAGTLAKAGRLTAASASEQASAGLDALTDEDRARFTDLNSKYMEKHGFPFIIAVRDHDRAGILTAFETRLGHDRTTEIAEACRQVERIAELRLEAMS